MRIYKCLFKSHIRVVVKDAKWFLKIVNLQTIMHITVAKLNIKKTKKHEVKM